MKRRKILFLGAALLLAPRAFTEAPSPESVLKAEQPKPVKTHSAVTPVSRPDVWWNERHEAILKRLKEGKVDLLFIGDSITHSWEKSPTHAWENNGEEIWMKYYAPRHAVNLGFSGDRTQHVLWRLDHGEVDGISPKLAVLMIGSNNSWYDYNTAEEIADGILAIIEKLHAKLPDTKLLVLGIFPRDEKPCAQRAKNQKANARVAQYVATETAKGNKWLHYLDLESKFLQPDGTLPKEIMPDFLHPNAKGYQIWAEAMEPKIVELMGEKK
ncbi:MAG TPA: platelet-activating factor acetylhydrolase IB subunit [Candidatus Sumerlaeota bacterium]|nr:platelet-activating factor acetylhydrolase IB subunit [Candidatus Sumerlaeota bacterium]HPS00549.1 platelet-activating factor acetylhydrolase IB subunit [Candidatus Sumerlaeota bacterium]